MVGIRPEKRQFLVHLEPALIAQTKILAVRRGTTASALVQQALTEFMERAAENERRTTASAEDRQ